MENLSQHEYRSTMPQVVIAPVLNRIDYAMSKLSPKHSEILILIDVRDFSYEATAILLEIPVKDMRERLARARHNFQRLMKLKA